MWVLLVQLNVYTTQAQSRERDWRGEVSSTEPLSYLDAIATLCRLTRKCQKYIVYVRSNALSALNEQKYLPRSLLVQNMYV